MGSLNDLVGEVDHARRNREAQRLGGLEIDDQRIFCRLLNRELGRTSAPEDTVDVGCPLRVYLDCVKRIGHQATSSGKVRRADPGQTVTGGGSADHIAMCNVKTVGKSDQAASRLAGLGGDGFFDLRVVVNRSKRTRYPERRGSRLDRAI